MAVYYGKEFENWQSDLLVAALKFAYLARLKLDQDNNVIEEEQLFRYKWGRLRDVLVAKSGKIYIVNDSKPGLLIELSKP